MIWVFCPCQWWISTKKKFGWGWVSGVSCIQFLGDFLNFLTLQSPLVLICTYFRTALTKSPFSFRSRGSPRRSDSGSRTWSIGTPSSSRGCSKVDRTYSGWRASSTLRDSLRLWDRRWRARTRAGRSISSISTTKWRRWWRRMSSTRRTRVGFSPTNLGDIEGWSVMWRFFLEIWHPPSRRNCNSVELGWAPS